MHVTARIFLLRMVDKVVRIALQRAIAAGRVGIETTARFDGDVGCFLHRLDSKVPRRLDDDTALAADPGDDRGAVFVVVPPTGLTFLAAPTRAAAQRLFPTVCRLAFRTRGVIAVIRFNSALSLTRHLRGERGMAEPPAPAIAGPDMEAHFPGNAPGGTGEPQQKGGKAPVRQRSLAPMQQGISKVVEGPLTAMAPGACAPGALVVQAPLANVVALAARTLQRTLLPPERMEEGLALCSAEEVGPMREPRHG